MTANMTDSRTFFTDGTPAQYEYVFNKYDEAVTCKAIQKNKKVADYVKLDKWFQVDLPKKIKSRGKDAHLVHEELVQCMKWKMSRGKFIPRIKDLVQMNTPRLCITESKKAFRALLKKDDLTAAIQAMCNLKGVGPAMASVMLTAADPTQCGFMADECLMAIPEIDSIDYTTKELLNFVEQLRTAAERLNGSGGSNWNAHRVEQTVWAHVVLSDLKKEALEGMPSSSAKPTTNGIVSHEPEKNGDGESSTDSADVAANKENLTSTNGATALDEDSNTCDSVLSTNTNEGTPVTSFSASAPPMEEDTNDSIATTGSGQASSHAEEDSINTASPQQQVSEDTNDSIPQESSSERTVVTQNGNGHISSSEDQAAVASTTVTAVSSINEDSKTNDSLAAASDSTNDSVPENSEKLISTPTAKLPLKDAVNEDEPSSKRAKLEE